MKEQTDAIMSVNVQMKKPLSCNHDGPLSARCSRKVLNSEVCMYPASDGHFLVIFIRITGKS
jgi:hypothetical protein